uniref:Uncharacterized protein n=1 Tax=Magallana gigas TaxID=29159 RepID=K1R1I8_MAGGI
MATFGGAMIDEEERPVDSGVIPKTYTTSPPLAHQVSAGKPCSNCRELCPGFELHFWSYCRDQRDAADIILQYTTNVISKLSDQKYLFVSH